MKIVNKEKFIKNISILLIIISLLIIFSKSTYSNVEIIYKEDYIYSGDTLWNISKKEIQNNKYFEGKDIREVVSELKYINNLSESNLKVGEKIRIPMYK